MVTFFLLYFFSPRLDKNIGFEITAQPIKLMNALYKEFSDEYEVLIFVGNRLDNIRS